jgi:hypothetical protein
MKKRVRKYILRLDLAKDFIEEGKFHIASKIMIELADSHDYGWVDKNVSKPSSTPQRLRQYAEKLLRRDMFF